MGSHSIGKHLVTGSPLAEREVGELQSGAARSPVNTLFLWTKTVGAGEGVEICGTT